MKELKIDATVQNLDEVLAFLDGELEGMDCPMKEQMQLDVAVEEIFVNIASYAYEPGTGYALIQIKELDAPKRVQVTFIDEGVPYDPLQKEDPDITLSAEERQIGGLGIYMVKQSMDNIYYEHKDNKNVLTIEKNI
ncbi:ATP-binding protein [Butyrivibrio sp. CB08]|uniref:ATP-binding protein n=1 Tax=Butyrivibrio sp. CB08 TaxID=2364879 RepID=UPI000EAA027E|nr:ATP-binding protein [Butyrivibrio sp. CB08]RKM59242.1 ATP-binding protein [Butyrivibrio sp. CB08]